MKIQFSETISRLLSIRWLTKSGNKKKPKKQGKFAKKMAEMMEKAEEQKRIQNRKK